VGLKYLSLSHANLLFIHLKTDPADHKNQKKNKKPWSAFLFYRKSCLESNLTMIPAHNENLKIPLQSNNPISSLNKYHLSLQSLLYKPKGHQAQKQNTRETPNNPQEDCLKLEIQSPYQI